MKYLTACLLLLFVLAVHSEEMPIVKMQTNLGTIVFELNPLASPKTVNNFLSYAQDGFYEGTIFHRVIKYFIIQGGGYTQAHEKKWLAYAPISNESNNGLKNLRGTIAMARNAQEYDSATSQFFINVKDNPSLDYGGSIYSDWGYTVFGHVIEGMNVVNKIRKLKTGSSAHFRKHVPENPVIIEKIFIENAPPLYNAPVSAEPTAEEEESHSTVLKKIQEKASLTESAEPEIQNEIQATEEEESHSTVLKKIQEKASLTETESAEPEIQDKTQPETLLVKPETQAKISLTEAEYDLAEPETRAKTLLAEAKVSLQKKPEKVVVQAPIKSSPKIFLFAPDPPSVSDKQEPLAD